MDIGVLDWPEFKKGMVNFHTLCLHGVWISCLTTFFISYSVSFMCDTITYPKIYLSDSISESPGSMIGGFGLSITAFFSLMAMLARQIIVGYQCNRQKTLDGPNEYVIAKLDSAASLTCQETLLSAKHINDERAQELGRVNKDNLKSIRVIFLCSLSLVGVGSIQVHNWWTLHFVVAVTFFGSMIFYAVSQYHLDLRLVQLGILDLSPDMLLFKRATVYGMFTFFAGIVAFLPMGHHVYAATCELFVVACSMGFLASQHTLFESVEISLAVRGVAECQKKGT